MRVLDVANYLKRESESLKTKNPSLSQYYKRVSKELSNSSQISVNYRSGKLLEEIMWPIHAKASAYFRTDAVGIKLPFPVLWLEIDAGKGGLKGMLLRQLKESMILGIAFENKPDPKDNWNIYKCEFLITVGTVSGRVRDEIEDSFPNRPELKNILDMYSTETIVPLPLGAYDSIQEIQGILSAMEFHFWSLCLFLNALKLPNFELCPTGANQYEILSKGYH